MAGKKMTDLHKTQTGINLKDEQEDRVGLAGEIKTLSPQKTFRWKKYRWVIWVVIMIPVLYFAVQVFIVLIPRMRTQFATQDTMIESIGAQGFIAMQSTPVEGSGGILYYTVPLGQRVSAGAEVAKVFSSEEAAEAMVALDRVKKEMELLDAAQRTLVEGGNVDVFLKQMQEGMFEYLGVLDTGNYSGLENAENNVTLATNKFQIVTGEAADFSERAAFLSEEMARLEGIAVPIGSITAPETGYFVPSSKYDRLLTDNEFLENSSPIDLQQKVLEEPAYYGGEVIGHIVADYKWSFYTVMSVKEADKLRTGDKLNISFPDYSESLMPVVVKDITIDEEAEIAKIELFCEYINPEILSMRLENAQIVMRTVKGIKIDKAALRIIEGERCAYVKFGNQVFERRIDVLLEDENYLLLSPTYVKGENEVELYDEVIVDSGGVELYDKKVL